MMTTTAAATDTSPMMIRMNSSNDPIEDLNRTLYDIGAQDLLDVWEAMEATVREISYVSPPFLEPRYAICMLAFSFYHIEILNPKIANASISSFLKETVISGM